MDVPEKRKGDLQWLRRNLPIRNSGHPDFKQVFQMVVAKLRSHDLLGATDLCDIDEIEDGDLCGICKNEEGCEV